MTRFPTGPGALWDVARAIHSGRTWTDVADALGTTHRQARAFYRPRIRNIAARLVHNDPTILGLRHPHGTANRYAEGPCHPDGRRCEPCMAARADLSDRERNDRQPIRTDEAFLQGIAERLHAGESWEDVAVSHGRTTRGLQHRIRELIQPYALELINRDQPSTNVRAHGSHAKYVVDRCRCEPCLYATRCYENSRRTRKARGLEPYADATKAREHVRWLQSQGIGLKKIAAASGVPHGSLAKLIYGDRQRGMAPSKRIRAATGRKLVAVTPADAASAGHRIDATQTKALLAALIDNGWTKTAVAQRLGTSCGNLLRGDQCHVATARAIQQLVRDEPFPPAEARRRGAGGRYGTKAMARERARRQRESRRLDRIEATHDQEEAA